MERMFQSFEGKFRTLLLEKTFHSLQALLKKKKLELSQKKKRILLNTILFLSSKSTEKS